MYVPGFISVMVVTFCLVSFASITLFKDAVEGEIVVMVITFRLTIVYVSSYSV